MEEALDHVAGYAVGLTSPYAVPRIAASASRSIAIRCLAPG